MQENRPVIALDFPEFSDVKDFLEKFDPSEQLYIKLGMELFYTAGPQVVYYVKSLGHSVFLDLKLHDIPNTVESSMRVLARLGVDMVNVHAAGGVEMMVAAKRGLEAGTPVGRQRPKLIAVTQLTSTSEEIMQNDQKIMTSLEESVINYAQKTAQAPGIRPEGASKGDQKRVMTPKEARTIGSDYIVVGRPITQAKDPVASYHAIKAEWNQ